jgi:hypothetical protein
MTYYAQIDTTVSSPQSILGWYDSDNLGSVQLPALKTLIQVTPDIYLSRQRFLLTYLENGVPVMPLELAKGFQITKMKQMYDITSPPLVSFVTAAGVTNTYQADSDSITNLQRSILGCSFSGATPTGFYWIASDNTKVPFTFADLQGLAKAIFEQGVMLFDKFQAKKALINASTFVADVQAITWLS